MTTTATHAQRDTQRGIKTVAKELQTLGAHRRWTTNRKVGGGKERTSRRRHRHRSRGRDASPWRGRWWAGWGRACARGTHRWAPRSWSRSPPGRWPAWAPPRSWCAAAHWQRWRPCRAARTSSHRPSCRGCALSETAGTTHSPSSSSFRPLLSSQGSCKAPLSKAAPKLHSLNLQSSKAPSLDPFCKNQRAQLWNALVWSVHIKESANGWWEM